jgi:ATP-dependent Clp protease adaptor protein ClpS
MSSRSPSVSAGWLAAVAAESGTVRVTSPRLTRQDAPVLDPVLDPFTDVDETTQDVPPWLVIVWDDPVNLMTYVTMVLRRVFGYSRSHAEQLMLRVHNEGRAVVAAEPREQAELHVAQLHGYGLQATIERDT